MNDQRCRAKDVDQRLSEAKALHDLALACAAAGDTEGAEKLWAAAELLVAELSAR